MFALWAKFFVMCLLIETFLCLSIIMPSCDSLVCLMRRLIRNEVFWWTFFFRYLGFTKNKYLCLKDNLPSIPGLVLEIIQTLAADVSYVFGTPLTMQRAQSILRNHICTKRYRHHILYFYYDCVYVSF